jgi:hypothetical protein
MRPEHERIRERLAAGWRMRCPAGHADLRDKQGPTVYCRGCSASYGYEELVDASETTTPIGRS